MCKFCGSLLALISVLGSGLARADEPTVDRLQAYLANFDYRAVATDTDPVGNQQLDAEINGHRVHLIVDTGSGLTTLTTSCARRLHLAVTDTGHMSIGAGGQEAGTTGEAGIRSLTLAGSEINQPGVVHVLPPGGGIRGADGLLGFDFLWLNSAIILVGGDGLLLHSMGRGSPAPLEGYLAPRGYRSVALNVTFERATVTGSMAGHPFVAELDCGAASSCFDPTYLKAAGIATHWTPWSFQGLDGRGVPVRGFNSRGLQIGTVEILPESFYAGTTPLLTMGQVDAVWGFDFLHRHHAMIDLAGNRLWLK